MITPVHMLHGPYRYKYLLVQARLYVNLVSNGPSTKYRLIGSMWDPCAL